MFFLHLGHYARNEKKMMIFRSDLETLKYVELHVEQTYTCESTSLNRTPTPPLKELFEIHSASIKFNG